MLLKGEGSRGFDSLPSHSSPFHSETVMSADVLREYINRTPFHLVTVFLPSGKTVTIGNPEFAMFSETGRTLLVFQGERLFIIDVATAEAAETASD